MAPTTGIRELKMATFPTGLQLRSLLYKEKPIVEMAMSNRRMMMPIKLMYWRTPPVLLLGLFLCVFLNIYLAGSSAQGTDWAVGQAVVFS